MSALSDKHVLSVSERSAAVWEYTAEEAPRVKSRRSFVNRTASHVHGDAENPTTGAENGAFDAQYAGAREGLGGINQGVAGPREKEPNSLHMGLGDTGDVKKVLNIKNMPDSSFTASTLMLPALEVRGSSSMNSMNMGQDKGLGSSSKPQYVLYCVAGHKLYAGTLPSYDKHNREMMNLGNGVLGDVSPFSNSSLFCILLHNCAFFCLFV